MGFGDYWPRRTRTGPALPPGQRELRVFPRFSAEPRRWPPRVPAEPRISIGGAVADEIEMSIADLRAAVPAVELVADFHCVTTWSVRGLRWEGIPFAAFWERVVVPRCRPVPGVGGIVLRGLDRASAVVALEDALDGDVLLADRLNGAPLDPVHGAPLRFVSPNQYGYKSVKHVCAIDLWTERPPIPNGPKEHFRARVALEERHATIGGRLLRGPYRLVIPLTAWLSDRAARQGAARRQPVTRGPGEPAAPGPE